jgi:hypothetical protein
VTVIDKQKNIVEVTKSKLGAMHWMRASAADELVNVKED